MRGTRSRPFRMHKAGLLCSSSRARHSYRPFRFKGTRFRLFPGRESADSPGGRSSSRPRGTTTQNRGEHRNHPTSCGEHRNHPTSCGEHRHHPTSCGEHRRHPTSRGEPPDPPTPGCRENWARFPVRPRGDPHAQFCESPCTTASASETAMEFVAILSKFVTVPRCCGATLGYSEF